ncbi:MAG: 4Fe-4S binding protein [bacterium]|nr:4Fe-4S binding protein [bacterium]
MTKNFHAAIFLKFALTVALVVGLSAASVALWGGKSGKFMDIPELQIDRAMTIAEFGQANSLANPRLKEIFDLTSRADLDKKLDDLRLSDEQIREKVEGGAALIAEEQSKDWMKILTKFVFWMIFLSFVFVLMRRSRINPGRRRFIYIASIMIFGVALGSDPSAMGTVKDAITLYATKGVVFPPRMIALSVFLLMVLIANKFICAWGCQAGVLQDFIFRLNRNVPDTRGIHRQYKPSFTATNTIRILFFGAFTLAAFLWSVDIIEFVDPFKVYKPAALGAAGMGFVLLLLGASLFVYRPWCHLFCPFGLVGWLVEKVSIFRIKVNYDTCISCEACAGACPSSVMNAILKQEQVIPDCFACANCIDVCPTKSVFLGAGRRQAPPAGKFHEKAAG